MGTVISSLGIVLAEDEEHSEGDDSHGSDESHGDDGAHEGADDHHGEEEVINPILPEANELIWGIICFALTYAIVRAFHPKISATMEEREARIAESRAAAEAATAEASAAMGDYEAKMSGARSEAAEIIEAARGRAGDYRAQVMGDAQAEVDQAKAQAMADIGAAKAAAFGSLRGNVNELATGAASTVVGRSLDVSAQTSTIDDYVNRNSSLT